MDMKTMAHSDDKAVKSDKKVSKKGRRIWEIDFLRGFCIIMMVLDHAMFDLMLLEGMAENFYEVDSFLFDLSFLAFDYWYWSVRIVVRFVILFIFLILSGISCTLSKNNTRRFFKLLIASSIISAVTVTIDLILDAGIMIVFGILHIMALSLLIYIGLKKITPSKYLCLGVGLAIFLGGFFIPFWDIWPVYKFGVSEFFEMLIGLLQYGSDSYGIVPYTGAFLIGAYIGETIYKDKKSLLPSLDRAWQKPMSFVGRNTLWVYLAHQIVVFLVVILVAFVAGYRFAI